MHTTTYLQEKPLPLAEQREIAKRVITGAQTFELSVAITKVPPALRFIQRQLLPTHSVMPFQLMRGIFALSAKTASSHRKLCHFDDVSNTEKGGSVEYKGAPLVQADLRVLLGLIREAAEKHKDKAELTLDAVDFLRSIGKKNPCSRSVLALADSISSLRSSTFVVKNFSGDRGAVFGFVESAKWKGRKVVVKMSPTAAWAFENVGRTYVKLEQRCLLADGVETALADLLASTAADSYDVADLAAMWGRADAKEMGREVRAALDRLVEVHLLKGWSKTRGRVHVQR